MVSVYSVKRKEPRVKLRAPVELTISSEDGHCVSIHTHTIDVSPRGASVRLEESIAVGTVLRFTAMTYRFATRAVVRSVSIGREAGGYSLGLEYLDHANPLVVWERCTRDQVFGDGSASR